MEIKTPTQNKAVETKAKAWVYVGTYGKYANGSIAGVWVCLDDHDKDTFLGLCRTIHQDESDPEIMLQDFEGFPAGYYCESGLHERIWEWLQLDENDKELLARYMDAVGMEDADIEKARDAYAGTADNEADFAETFAEEIGGLPEDMPAWVVIDWQATWDCNLRHDFVASRAEDGSVWFFHR
jgi:antirestriction protein